MNYKMFQNATNDEVALIMLLGVFLFSVGICGVYWLYKRNEYNKYTNKNFKEQHLDNTEDNNENS